MWLCFHNKILFCTFNSRWRSEGRWRSSHTWAGWRVNEGSRSWSQRHEEYTEPRQGLFCVGEVTERWFRSRCPDGDAHKHKDMCVNRSDSSSHVPGLILAGRTAKRKKNKLQTLYIKVQVKHHTVKWSFSQWNRIRDVETNLIWALKSGRLSRREFNIKCLVYKITLILKWPAGL